jgi:hypothetical protein
LYIIAIGAAKIGAYIKLPGSVDLGEYAASDPAKGTKPAAAVPPVTKKPQRGRLR